MYVDSSRPLPIPEEKKDYLGSVLDALLGVHYSRIEAIGDEVEFKEKITVNTALANQKLDQYALDIDNALKAHADKRGAQHGETKVTVGLGNKDNWRFATPAEHVAGQIKTAYANPAGLKQMVEARLTIDPKKYIYARVIPLASGGQLGSVNQWPFSWEEGEVVQSPTDPMNFYGETAWQFRTDSGVYVFPAMNGSDVLTQAVADPGRSKRAALAWGGTNVRVYNRNLDLRRSRPSYLRAESNNEPNNELLKASSHLFDRHTAYYADTNLVGARGFNRYRLPFDVLSNGDKWKNNWSGILEVRENFLYNIVSKLVYDNVGGYGQDVYLTIELYPYTFTQDGIDVKNGSGRAAETTAQIQDTYGTVTYTLPGGNKVRSWTRSGKPTALCIKLRDIVTYTDAQLPDVVAAINAELSKRILFTWRNRLKGDFALRIPVGFYSKDKKYYTNYYVDLALQVTENTTTKSVAVNVLTLRDLTANVQTLNANLQVGTTGRFVQYPASVAGDVMHPLVMNGTFDSLGGHVKVYTFYNRQYVGYYQHNVDSALTWINNGDSVKPALTKYQYAQMSTMNQDGFYGDHLRHIPLGVTDAYTDYLVHSRDWRHNYRWAIARIDTDETAQLLTPTGHHRGPWRDKITWIEPKDNLVPSFVISNSELSAGFDNTCLVFNTQNAYTGYARYGYDSSNPDEPLTWLDPVTLDLPIQTWLAQNGGAWVKNHKQVFYYRGTLYWFSQTLDQAEVKADGTDCYYGIIKNAYIDVQGNTRTMKINGDITANATINPLKVNTKASLAVDSRNIVGWDAFNSTDIYIMLMERTGNVSRYQVMVNLAPFNNFYFEFETTINTTTGDTTFLPNTKAVDPVFPYAAGLGFSVDYNKVTGYGTKTPHQFHVNFQTPVMLKKSMWSFRKTPGNYGLFSQSIGTVIAQGGILNAIKGVPIYPVGSIVTVGGSNIVTKSPVNAAYDYFEGDDELFVKQGGVSQGSGTVQNSNGLILYGRKHSPGAFETEPNSGVVPCGFLKNNLFYHYDPDGWRTDLLPIIDNKRMSFYGYGSSFPAFLGIAGSGTPINRFFLSDKPTILSWNTALGRDIPVGSGSNIKVTINNVAQTYAGGGTFTIPATYTGTVDVYITGMTRVKWAVGLTNLKQIGNTVTALDFSNSTSFTVSAALPKRITTLKGLFKGATGATYSGLDLWDTSNVVDMSELCMNTTQFNHDLSKWNVGNVVTFENAFANAQKFNSAITGWNTAKVKSMKNMFLNAVAFNQAIGNWNTARVTDFSYMFKGAVLFNGNIGNWNTSSGSDFTSMFEGASVFNIDIGRWDMGGAIRLTAMFKNAIAFNGSIINWNVSNAVYMDEMFYNATAFNRAIGMWDTGRVTTMYQMFMNTTNFGINGTASLTGWNVSNVIDATRMFKSSKFNSTIGMWKFGQDAILTEMFASNTVFNQDISSWDVSNVKAMDYMFNAATAFATSITGWHLDSCTTFAYMFANSNFSGSVAGWVFSTTVDISMIGMFSSCPFFAGTGVEDWNTGRVITFQGMFNGATIFNGDVSGWDVGHCSAFRNMFRKTNLFNCDLSGWDMSLAVDISDMFREAAAFNGDVTTWNTSNIQLMNGTFVSAVKFNQDISNWDTSKVINFTAMFQMTIFNQDISGWDTSSATTMEGMFSSATQFNQDLSSWIVSKVTNHVNFDTGATAWVLPRPAFPS